MTILLSNEKKSNKKIGLRDVGLLFQKFDLTIVNVMVFPDFFSNLRYHKDKNKIPFNNFIFFIIKFRQFL